MVLDNYIKQDFVKDEFMKSCLIVSDIYEAECLAKSKDINNANIIFKTSSVKAAFFSKMKIYFPGIKIINCDSSKSRLMKELSSCDHYMIILDKVNYCNDFDIFNEVNKMNRILVC